MGSARQISLISSLSIGLLARAMSLVRAGHNSSEQASSTLFRFFRSRHVEDLRFIFFAAVFAGLLDFLVLLLPFVATLDPNSTLGQNLVDTRKFLGPFLVPGFAVIAAAIAWSYQSASSRLGVVDLFACEISTLCRVGSIFDVANRYIERYDSIALGAGGGAELQQGDPPAFVSQEEYFPVFDNNARDLQLLDRTVVSHITEFYTYMKAARDSLRRAAGPARQEAVVNVIFMTFLAYESARRAVRDLIEFEPAAAECTVVILLTELECYSFLLRIYPAGDVRNARLKLREAAYKKEVPALWKYVSSHRETDPDWLSAIATVPELQKQFERVFPP